jgi:hypothetical protein
VPNQKMMRRIIAALTCVYCLLDAFVCHASPLDEFQGVRSAAMGGAHRGVGTSNDTLMLNPAGMAVAKRYALEMNYGYAGLSGGSVINVSAVDSKSGPVAGGVGYTLDVGGIYHARVHRIYFSTAYAITEYIAFGVTARHLRGQYTLNGASTKLALFTGDAGLAITPMPGFTLGVTYHNIYANQRSVTASPGIGTGIGFTKKGFTLASDIRIDIRNSKNRMSYHGGLEYFAFGRMPFRIGYLGNPRDLEKKNDLEHVITSGIGWVESKSAIDVSYQHSLSEPKHWVIMSALKFFL